MLLGVHEGLISGFVCNDVSLGFSRFIGSGIGASGLRA